MTLGLFAAAAVLALVPSRLAILPLVGAAVLAVGGGEVATLAGVWTAALAAGLLLLGRPPRALAVPLVGAGAVLIAGTVTNAAVVGPAWVVGTAAAVLSRRGAAERRWGLGALAADVPVLAAIGWTALEAGFVSWPATLSVGASALLLGAAAAKAVAAAGADDRAPEGGLLVVRAQAVVGVVLAVGGGTFSSVPEEGIAVAAALLGALAVAAGGALALRDGTSDVLVELGLFGAVLGGSALGWEPAGWTWGALAAGTLTHWSRVRVSAPAGRWAWLEGLVTRGGGLGSPFLPVGAALFVGAVGAGGLTGGAVAALAVGGLGVRAASARGHPGRGAIPSVRARARALALTAALAAALWAPLLSLPRPPGGEATIWPPAWGLVALLMGAAAGARFPERFGPRQGERPASDLPRLRLPAGRPPAAVTSSSVLLGGLGLAAAGAVAIWTVGLLRGFL